MVVCGDGSGRTGTLIAIYKLWIDLEDQDCGSLALLPTGRWKSFTESEFDYTFVLISFGFEVEFGRICFIFVLISFGF